MWRRLDDGRWRRLQKDGDGHGFGQILVAGLGLDVADEVAVVPVVGCVKEAQVVPTFLPVKLYRVGVVQRVVSDSGVVVAVSVGPDPVERGPRCVDLWKKGILIKSYQKYMVMQPRSGSVLNT